MAATFTTKIKNVSQFQSKSDPQNHFLKSLRESYHQCFAEGARLELTTELPATCFQDKLLIRPDTLYVAESEGLEPSSQVHENCLSRTV